MLKVEENQNADSETSLPLKIHLILSKANSKALTADNFPGVHLQCVLTFRLHPRLYLYCGYLEYVLKVHMVEILLPRGRCSNSCFYWTL